ncbi:hypothetical protein BO71DRAFT_402400 [Aspergillus ellipticus CBS 707.79]|uniref:Uncharacterized protein n=1 Tax=Aspergillus ellipticus CBS 707.79 TaxID=1448320 RepID=A0A319DGN1_9EURO|nr:hypothetical protein BO71DRAFT_402400 [Aspergillus ellipticus CBS 707.79]
MAPSSYFVHYLFARKNAGAWRFLPSDTWGNPRWVHPLVPVVELDYLLQRLLAHDDRDFPHAFLYQAMLYAGSVFLDPLELEAVGYPPRQTIAQVFRERARVSQPTPPQSSASSSKTSTSSPSTRSSAPSSASPTTPSSTRPSNPNPAPS